MRLVLSAAQRGKVRTTTHNPAQPGAALVGQDALPNSQNRRLVLGKKIRKSTTPFESAEIPWAVKHAHREV
jgi:hypothetical protein